eukprot:11622-Heterococcus_DN1.PRE.1
MTHSTQQSSSSNCRQQSLTNAPAQRADARAALERQHSAICMHYCVHELVRVISAFNAAEELGLYSLQVISVDAV